MFGEPHTIPSLFSHGKGVVLLVSYSLLFTSLGLLIKYSRREGQYNYDVTTMIFITEFVKLVLATLLFTWRNQVWAIFEQRNMKAGLYYTVPAVVYSLYNNVYYVNLSFFDPGSFQVLMNIRIAITGVLTQILFHVSLGVRRWIALVLLMIGCTVHQLDISRFQISTNPLHLLFLVLQCTLSSFAGVYNEHLLKRDIKMDVNLQNIYLYTYSLVANILIFVVYSLVSSGGGGNRLIELPSVPFTPLVVAIILVSSVGGLVTSMILKYLSSILKAYAASMNMFITTIASYYLFGTPLEAKAFLSIGLISYSLYLYNTASSTPPASPLPTTTTPQRTPTDMRTIQTVPTTPVPSAPSLDSIPPSKMDHQVPSLLAVRIDATAPSAPPLSEGREKDT